MNEMLERVEKVLAAQFEATGDFDTQKAARAAIEAMREPTQDMLDAVAAADQQEPFSDKTMRGVYCEMIDAALKE